MPEINVEKLHTLNDMDKCALLFFIIGVTFNQLQSRHVELINEEIDKYAEIRTR